VLNSTSIKLEDFICPISYSNRSPLISYFLLNRSVVPVARVFGTLKNQLQIGPRVIHRNYPFQIASQLFGRQRIEVSLAQHKDLSMGQKVSMQDLARLMPFTCPLLSFAFPSHLIDCPEKCGGVMFRLVSRALPLVNLGNNIGRLSRPKI
jgi:hypothetical protein